MEVSSLLRVIYTSAILMPYPHMPNNIAQSKDINS